MMRCTSYVNINECVFYSLRLGNNKATSIEDLSLDMIGRRETLKHCITSQLVQTLLAAVFDTHST